MIHQYTLTPAAGKRLIAKAVARDANVQEVLKSGTLVIIGGTTNAYVAEEILAETGQAEAFDRRAFLRGVTLPPGGKRPARQFMGDVVLHDGQWDQGKTIFDVAGDLKEGDLVIKGANALDLTRKRAGIYIEHPKAGTIGVAIQAVVGRRVRLLIPVGLEKRVDGAIDDLAARLNQPGARGPRLFPAPGDVFTELDALHALTGAHAFLTGAGGVCGAEGCVWVAVEGTQSELDEARKLMESVLSESAFAL